MPAVLATYRGHPPDNQELRRRLRLEGDRYTYIVSTPALGWLRADLAPPHQRDADDVPQMIFQKFVRHLCAPRSILSRTEERFLLQRAAADLPAGHARQARHDIEAWRAALADLTVRGVDLSAALPPEVRASAELPVLADILEDLGPRFVRAQAEEGRLAYEAQAVRLLARYEPTPTVVLEGFNYPLALPRRFIRRCLAHGATVIFVQPYHAPQAFGFAVQEASQAEFRPGARRISLGQAFPAGTDLSHLQGTLFADDPPPAPGGKPDGSVTLEGYASRSQEVAACLERVRAALDRKVPPGQIAIVMRNPEEFLPELEEEARLRGLAHHLHLPPRRLLLTPVGRFVLLLYSVWRDGQLVISAEQFEAALASGWLGTSLQATTQHFSALAPQLFNRCGDRASWDAALARLGQLAGRSTASRLPALTVPDRLAGWWTRTLDLLTRLCAGLYASPRQSIGAHVRTLLGQLRQLNPVAMPGEERAIVERLREALEEATRSDTLEVSPQEFGEVLSGMARQYQEEEEAQEHKDYFLVTTPEGIDGVSRRVVCYLGVDSQRVPVTRADPWPVASEVPSTRRLEERYLFLAAVRAAGEELHLSYARADLDGPRDPSAYLLECGRALGRPVVQQHLPALVTGTPPEAPRPARPIRRDEYNLSDLAHARLCPHRFQAEQLDPRARQYRDPFQMFFFAEGMWINRVLARLRAQGTVMAGAEEARAVLLQTMEDVRPDLEATFPAIASLEWDAAACYVRESLQGLAEQAGGREVTVEEGRHVSLEVPVRGRTVMVRVHVPHVLRIGGFLRPVVNAHTLAEWLLPGTPTPAGQPALREVEGLQVPADLYQAVQWWAEALRAIFYAEVGADTPLGPEFLAAAERLRGELVPVIEQVEGGRFPKNTGSHCQYCPLRGECLGLM